MSRRLKTYLDDDNFFKAKKFGVNLNESKVNILIRHKALKINFGTIIFQAKAL